MMKKGWKKGIVTALSLTLAVECGMPMPVLAASSGWRKDTSGNWRYVNSNGTYKTGWFQDKDGKWYFLDYHTGVMKTGWIKPRDGKWYFMDYHNGSMLTGWIKPKDGKWYFLDYHNGDMLSGWIKPRDGKWYYLDTGSGAMQTGTVSIGGKQWTLNSDGTWDEKASSSSSSVTKVNASTSSSSSSSGRYYYYTPTITKLTATVSGNAVKVEESGTVSNRKVTIPVTASAITTTTNNDKITETVNVTGFRGTASYNGTVVDGYYRYSKENPKLNESITVTFVPDKAKYRNVQITVTFVKEKEQ